MPVLTFVKLGNSNYGGAHRAGQNSVRNSVLGILNAGKIYLDPMTQKESRISSFRFWSQQKP